MVLRRALLALVPCLMLSGCCSLSRLFCGPDDSRWVSIAYDTPTATVATLLEAIRRDAPDVVYSCLSAGFRQKYELDSFSAQLAWEQLKAQVPGLHLAGYAEIPAPTPLSSGGFAFTIDVEGHVMHIELQSAFYREVVYSDPEGNLYPASKPVSSFVGLAHSTRVANPDFDKSRLAIDPFEFEHEGFGDVPLETIQRAGLVRHWKVSKLRMPQS